ncbi:Uncharacterized protein family, basic secretory protein [Cynara cardunculus var. scolymus]|uniref:Uncharacterized protein family, basic secretory protein n=2 Tax=Cynara cardunculus var. scolymus TaxID=59895 RepID=A0A118K0U7_CYNCS|nr:Uncharacterized protein family, basic secretory protein [Cynara cardunculus var. scolymus]
MATTNFIWSVIFQQNNPSDRKSVDSVNVYIEEFNEPIAFTWDNHNVNFSSIYIAGFSGDVKSFFLSVMYHEMTHVFHGMVRVLRLPD